MHLKRMVKPSKQEKEHSESNNLEKMLMPKINKK